MALPEIDPSCKIQPRSRGELNHPGSCAVCGSGDPERTYVDFGVYYDYEGSMYVCNLCFEEAAVKVMGYFTQEEHSKLLNLNNELILKCEELEKELADARPILDAVRNVLGPVDYPSVGGILSDSTPAEDNSDGAEEQPEAPELPSGEGSTDTGGTKPRNRSKPVIV